MHAVCCAIVAACKFVLLARSSSDVDVQYWPDATMYHSIGGSMWSLSFVLVLLEVRHSRNAGASLRLWWLLAGVVAVLSLPRDAETRQLASSPAGIVRIVANSVAILLGLLAGAVPAVRAARSEITEGLRAI